MWDDYFKGVAFNQVNTVFMKDEVFAVQRVIISHITVFQLLCTHPLAVASICVAPHKFITNLIPTSRSGEVYQVVNF